MCYALTKYKNPIRDTLQTIKLPQKSICRPTGALQIEKQRKKRLYKSTKWRYTYISNGILMAKKHTNAIISKKHAIHTYITKEYIMKLPTMFTKQSLLTIVFLAVTLTMSAAERNRPLTPGATYLLHHNDDVTYEINNNTPLTPELSNLIAEYYGETSPLPHGDRRNSASPVTFIEKVRKSPLNALNALNLNGPIRMQSLVALKGKVIVVPTRRIDPIMLNISDSDDENQEPTLVLPEKKKKARKRN